MKKRFLGILIPVALMLVALLAVVTVFAGETSEPKDTMSFSVSGFEVDEWDLMVTSTMTDGPDGVRVHDTKIYLNLEDAKIHKGVDKFTKISATAKYWLSISVTAGLESYDFSTIKSAKLAPINPAAPVTNIFFIFLLPFNLYIFILNY